jgi:hypothetical protein
VFADASTASRPVLAVASVRALLARADAIISEHTVDIERRADALSELRRIYGLIEEVAAAGTAGNVPASSRAACAKVLAEHFAHNAVLGPQAPVGAGVAVARAQAAIALLDLQADGVTRRVDAADALALTGARRALLLERGILFLDETGVAEGRIASLRTMLDRLFTTRDGLEAVVVGEATRLTARDGAVVPVPAPDAATPTLWGTDVEPPAIDPFTTAIARGLAGAVLSTAITRRPALSTQIAQDGGADSVAPSVAMLALDAPRAVKVAALRLVGGHPASATALTDAVSALCALVPAGAPPPCSVAVGSANGGPVATRLMQVAIAPTGPATSFRLDKHLWLFERDAGGAVSGMRRDGTELTQASSALR